jgi:hypothetical protein
MKKLVFIVLLFIINFVNSQSLKDVLLNKKYEIDFVGIDFSEAKLVGTSSDFRKPRRIIKDYFSRWNNMFHIDADKYELTNYFRKENINLLTETVDSINNIIDPYNLVVHITPKRLNSKLTQKMINKYEVVSDNEVSMVFIINSLNKLRKQAIVDIVYFNNKSKEIIFKTTITSEPGGFGLKNYWEGAFLNLFKQVKKKEYKKWKKQFKK